MVEGGFGKGVVVIIKAMPVSLSLAKFNLPGFVFAPGAGVKSSNAPLNDWV